MTNDQIIGKAAPLIKALAKQLGMSITIGFRFADEFIPRPTYSAAVGDVSRGYGSADTPFAALTDALADYERREAEKQEKAEIEAEIKARRAQKQAA